MKKHIFFWVVILVLISFFACNLQIPSEVVIKGTPAFRFTVSGISIGEMFEESIHEAIEEAFKDDDEMILIRCTGTAVQTYMVYSELFIETIKLDNLDIWEDMSDELKAFLASYDINFTTTKPEVLFVSSLDIPFNDVGDIIPGFTFKDAFVSLYISSAGELAGLFSTQIDFDDGEPPINTHLNRNQAKVFQDSWEDNGYSGAEVPPGGNKIPFNRPLDEDFKINFSVYIDEGTVISSRNLFDDVEIVVEAIIWLPLVLAGADGGSIDLPEDMFPDTDLFGRDSVNDDFLFGDVIESFVLEMVLDNNPFVDVDLVILNNGVEFIRNPLTSSTLFFPISEKDMDKLNSELFIPKIKIEFNDDSVLTIPRDFKINIKQFAFSARVNYTIGL
jgi:hypothetical protein